VFHYLFSFSGRINRAKLWAFYFVAMALEIPILAIAVTGLDIFRLLELAGSPEGEATAFGQLAKPTGAVSAIAIVVLFAILFWSSCALMVKRLHDRNRPAIWCVYFLIGPLALDFLGFSAAHIELALGQRAAVVNVTTLPFVLLAMAVLIWGWGELYLLRGTAGDNRFGPDPLGAKTE